MLAFETICRILAAFDSDLVLQLAESRQRTLATMEIVYGRLAVALKGVPLYPVLGNHAGVPVDAVWLVPSPLPLPQISLCFAPPCEMRSVFTK
jgi:hypothetical protein